MIRAFKVCKAFDGLQGLQGPDNGIVYTDLSVTTGAPTPGGSLSYSSVNGEFSFSPHFDGALQNNLDTNNYKITGDSSNPLTIEWLLSSSPMAQIELGGNTSRETISLLTEGSGGSVTDGVTITGGSIGSARRITVENLPFRFANMSSTDRGSFQAQPGMVIFNTTTQKLEVYTGFTWEALH